MRPACTDCRPCDQHPCFEQAQYGVFVSTTTHFGCCDCSEVKLWVGWNFESADFVYHHEDPCEVPDQTTIPPLYPDCLRLALEAHGGFLQVEIYYGIEPGFWPEYNQIGIPDSISDETQALIPIPRFCIGPPVNLPGGACDMYGAITTGTCRDCADLGIRACDWELIYGEVGFIVRAQDGFEALRGVVCGLAGKDGPLPPCSSSSSSSSSSSDTSSSSSSTSSGLSSSSSSTTVDNPSSSSSSSSSSDTPSSSSSSSSGCSCYVQLDMWTDAAGVTHITAATAGSSAECLVGGSWVISAGENMAAASEADFELAPCTTYAVTATFTAPGMTCSEARSYKTPCGSSSSSSS